MSPRARIAVIGAGGIGAAAHLPAIQALADQVELEDVTASTAAIGVEGPGAAAALAELGAPVPGEYQHLAWGEDTVAGITETGQPGVRIYCAADRAGEITARLVSAGVKPASFTTSIAFCLIDSSMGESEPKTRRSAPIVSAAQRIAGA